VTIQNHWSSGGSVDGIFDVQGYVADTQTDASGLINTIQNPQVICDTATNSGKQCSQPNSQGLRGGQTITFNVLGQGGSCPQSCVPSSGVSAVVLNVQAYAESAPGTLVTYPAGGSRPFASSIIWSASAPTTSHLIVPVDATGQLSIYNWQGSHDGTQVSIGVDGWFTDNSNPSATGGLYYPNNGTLVCDTVANTNTLCSGGGQLTHGTPLQVQITGLGGVPAASPGVIGVELVLTVTNVNLPQTSPPTGTNVCVYASNSSCQEADLNLYGGVPGNLLVIVPSDQRARSTSSPPPAAWTSSSL
jgi:hypothetical protein